MPVVLKQVKDLGHC